MPKARASDWPSSIAERIEKFDWDAVGVELGAHGAAVIGPVLSANECKTLIDGYDDEDRYRSRVVMARHGFGRGEYKYFAYPLRPLVAELRASLYPYLAARGTYRVNMRHGVSRVRSDQRFTMGVIFHDAA